MSELIIEMAIYLGIAALLGLILGYLIWGLGLRRRLAAARAEGAATARTTVDGDTSLRDQLDASQAERHRLEQRIERLTARLDDQAAEAHNHEQDADAVEEAVEDMPIRLGLSEETDQSMEAAAEAYPRPANEADLTVPQGGRSIFRRRTEEPEPEADSIFTDEAAKSEDTKAEDSTPQEATAEAPTEAPEPAVDTAEQISAAVSEDLPAEAWAMDAEAPPPASLLAERPDEIDDLKRIKGVGPVMEQVLNDKGVYLFHQLANFSMRDIAWVNSAIDAFPGRIERDDWVGQAQALYREKYGRGHEED
ncbi:MAG: hypothetical protein AAGJ28_20995 [Pseudomonadota bacterium]